MAGKSNTTSINFALKKLFNKANTSNLKSDTQELIASNVQMDSTRIFAESIPSSPNREENTIQGGTVEYITFQLEEISGTNYDANDAGGGSGSDSGESGQTGGVHAYALKLPSDYSTGDSDNTKKGSGNWISNKVLHTTLGGIQLVPTLFSTDAPNPYIVKLYKEGDSGGIGDEIPALDDIDWSIDYYNGVIFLQDFDSNKVPAFARAFAYVGDMLDTVLTTTAGDITAVTAGTGLTGGGDSGAVTLDVDRPFSRTKIVQKVLVQQSAETIFTITGSNMSTGKHDPSYIDLFLNGQLLQSGSNSEVISGNADYTLVNDSKVKFSFDIEANDSITLIVFPK